MIMFNQKVLCLGSSSIESDQIVTNLTEKEQTVNHGLINDPNFVPTEFGYYHTSVVDLVQGDIVSLSEHFDKIILLDQPKEQYNHYKIVISTLQTCLALEQKGCAIEFRDVPLVKRLIYWKTFLKENKSFCFHPFLALIDNTGDYTSICPKNWKPVKRLKDITDWKTDPEYLEIRNKMIDGVAMPDTCWECYEAEDRGYESTRQFETVEWAEKLELDSIEDFLNVEKPVFFEIRPSNKCNAMCRFCSPNFSHLIRNEYDAINFKVKFDKDREWDTLISGPDIESIDYDHARRIYFAGGEPTIMPEFYNFLQNRISDGNTNFELTIGTNGMSFSNKLLDLLDHFPNVCLSTSFDGYGKVNDYVRWRTEFDTVVNNTRILRERGHIIGLQTVICMWNLTNLGRLFEFFDQEYPNSSLLLQPAKDGEEETMFDPYNHPLPEQVVESLSRCQQTNVYYSNGRSLKSMIDALKNQYADPNYECNLALLQKFFDYNDKLDDARNVKLVDYIPELDKARNIL